MFCLLKNICLLSGWYRKPTLYLYHPDPTKKHPAFAGRFTKQNIICVLFGVSSFFCVSCVRFFRRLFSGLNIRIRRRRVFFFFNLFSAKCQNLASNQCLDFILGLGDINFNRNNNVRMQCNLGVKYTNRFNRGTLHNLGRFDRNICNFFQHTRNVTC